MQKKQKKKKQYNRKNRLTARQSREASKAKSTINNEEYESISQVATFEMVKIVEGRRRRRNANYVLEIFSARQVKIGVCRVCITKA